MNIVSENKMTPFEINVGDNHARLLADGSLFELRHNNVMLNLYRPDLVYGPISNLFIRLYENGKVQSTYPLMVNNENTSVYLDEDSVIYNGSINNIEYVLEFRLSENNIFTWDLQVNTDAEYDLLFLRDLGLADKGAILVNELYNAQYIDYKVFQNENGYNIVARQNMGSHNPFIQFGSINANVVAFASDGQNLFSESYKKDNQVKALNEDLPSQIIQGEFSIVALQTEKITGSNNVTFYAYFENQLDEKISELRGMELVSQFESRLDSVNTDDLQKIEIINLSDKFGEPFSSVELSNTEIIDLYPQRKLVETEASANASETDESKIYSFFTNNHEHVATQAKEVELERPHGNIITTFFDYDKNFFELLSSTNYIYGLFNSQVVIGNTSMNKGLSTNRGYLNQVKTSGQRLYVKIDGKYRLLQMPAVFEMGLGHSKWTYVLPNNDKLFITTSTMHDNAGLVLDVVSEKGEKYDFVVSNQFVLGEHEFTNKVNTELSEDGEVLKVTSAANNEFYPNLSYLVQVPGVQFKTGMDNIFFEDNSVRNDSLITLEIEGQDKFQLVLTAYLNDEVDVNSESVRENTIDLGKNKKLYLDSYDALVSKAKFNAEAVKDLDTKLELETLNETIWWFAHNAMVHFADPHGLEQPGGAAWGTRDVCQGPLEFFYTFAHYDLAKSVILDIFKHQNSDSGEWPQWFMFDNYPFAAGDCHGDVVFWPIKVISEYLEYTEDFAVLNEKAPYIKDGHYTEPVELIEHIKLAYSAIRSRFIDNTHLISYAGGDWNDTLQPASEQMREKMISTWTQALAYQALRQLSTALENSEFIDLARQISDDADEIAKDFNELLIKDDVVSGFAIRNSSDDLELLLHPEDETTGIKYRMLPMTRSVIAELVDEKQAARNLELVEEKLLYHDGAHLMDNPPHYDGGVSELFQRAEQASYVGRETSLMYTHAHIRYMEALAKMGNAKAWKNIFTINPIAVNRVVDNAVIRQRNLYFSSSEGEFTDRYDFAENYGKLKSGDIKVKGGWRLYSSGPGIYLHQVISNIMGVKILKDTVLINPSLSSNLDGAEFEIEINGEVLSIEYKHTGSLNVYADNSEIGEHVDLAYGKQGVVISVDSLENVNKLIIEY